MGILSADTAPDAERVQFEILRSQGPLGRLRLLEESVLTSWALVALQARAPERWLGFEPPEGLKLGDTGMKPLQTPLKFAGILHTLGVRYAIGGSYASSIHGEPRSTRDCDFLVEISAEQISELEALVSGDFYISREAALEALRLKRSFNLIHLTSGFKIDVFCSPNREFDRERLSRAKTLEIEGTPIAVSTAEDTILAKLEWHATAHSEQQWRDILGVMLLQGERLDMGYLRFWARKLGVESALEQAWEAAGGSEG